MTFSAIKREGNITYYFFELENKRESFKEMLDKYKRYEDYFGHAEMQRRVEGLQDVHRRHADQDGGSAAENILRFLAGEPVTEYRGGKGSTIVNPTPIKRSNFWFTTDELVQKLETKSFATPRDFKSVTYSLLD